MARSRLYTESEIPATRPLEWIWPESYSAELWECLFLANKRGRCARPTVDCVFLGDSISEAWGTPLPHWMMHGLDVERRLARNRDPFKQFSGAVRQAMFQYLVLAVWVLLRLAIVLPRSARVWLLSVVIEWSDWPRPVWTANFTQAPLRCAYCGIGGDRTRHLLWRIQNGELDGCARSLKVVALMIGVNNLGYGESSPDETASGVLGCVEALLFRYPNVHVVVQALLPAQKVEAPGTPAVKSGVRVTNKILARSVEALRRRGKAVTYVDMRQRFASGVGGQMPSAVSPDQLHLSAAGYDIWAAEIKPILLELVPPLEYSAEH